MSLTSSANINQAIHFITRPLSTIHTPATIHALQTILHSTFYAALMASSGGPLILNFTTAVPPRPVFAACIAIGIQWAEWIQLLGLREFDLIIDTRSAVIRYHATANGLSARTLILGVQPELTNSKRSILARLAASNVPQVPISKLGQQLATGTTTPASKSTAVAPPCRIELPSASLFIQPRTLAQQLIDSDDEEADELFAMISKTSIITPTPTKERFCIPSRPFIHAVSPISSPEPSSPDSSRPSSRSSSYFSEEGSVSSSPSSVDDVVFEDDGTESKVYVDTSKNEKTKYLYQGGVSSTLTGGVMLGRPSSAKPKVAAAPPVAKPHTIRAPVKQQQQRYKAPVGGRWSNGSNANSVPSWRRTTTAPTLGRW